MLFLKKRVMQKQVLNELSKELLSGNVQKDCSIVLDAFDKKLVFRKPIKDEQKKSKKIKL